MCEALFLDRDGVINIEIGDYITSEINFELNRDIYPIIKKANANGWKVIVITNQGGIGKKLYTHEKLNIIHQKMVDLLGENGCRIDDLYYCPHHPEFTGKCICRKPDSLMLEKAIHIYRLNKSKCLFIGDNIRDIEAANRAGIRGMLIESNKLPAAETIDL